MNKNIVLAAVFVMCSAFACSSGFPPLPSAADATRVQGRFAGSNVESLREGRSLYVARCGTCHALRDPASLSADAWPEQVHDMRIKGARMSDEEEQRITAYLMAISSRSSAEPPKG